MLPFHIYSAIYNFPLGLGRKFYFYSSLNGNAEKPCRDTCLFYIVCDPLSSKSDRRLRLWEELIPEWTLATPPNSLGTLL
jgi:hypothetical protein